jgi:hypothetical protein
VKGFPGRPPGDRRARLEDVVAGSELVFPAPTRAGRPGGVEAVVERGYEGYVAKDESSAYEGGPTRRWLKVKQKGWTVEEDRWRRGALVARPPPGTAPARTTGGATITWCSGTPWRAAGSTASSRS